MDQTAAQRYSAAPDYPQVAVDAIQEMVRQVGPCQLDESGLMKKGVIIRHLILPGQVDGAKAVMDWVAETFPKGTVLFSLMSQYTPWGDLSNVPEIDRRLRRGRYAPRSSICRIWGWTASVRSAPAPRRSTPALRPDGLTFS